MTEVKFTSSPRRDAEEPLYLDSARPRAVSSRPAQGVPAAERPLHLDYARAPRPQRRGLPLLLACALTFLMGAGAGVLYLKPPAVLRDTFPAVFGSEGTGDANSEVLGSARTGEAKSAPQSASMEAEPAQGAIPVSQVERPTAPEGLPAPSATRDLPPESPPVAEPAAKPQATASKPRPRHAAALKKPTAAAPKKPSAGAPKKSSADAKSAHAHSKGKAPLDLDALEKSLQ